MTKDHRTAVLWLAVLVAWIAGLFAYAVLTGTVSSRAPDTSQMTEIDPEPRR